MASFPRKSLLLSLGLSAGLSLSPASAPAASLLEACVQRFFPAKISPQARVVAEAQMRVPLLRDLVKAARSKGPKPELNERFAQALNDAHAKAGLPSAEVSQTVRALRREGLANLVVDSEGRVVPRQPAHVMRDLELDKPLPEAEALRVRRRKKMFLAKNSGSYRSTIIVETTAEGKAVQAIVEFLIDPSRVMDRMLEFERDVVARAKADGIRLDEARTAVLREWETMGGFGPARQIKAILNAKDFAKVLKSGQLFDDVVFKRNAHGVQSHRIQWNIIMREMDRHPELFFPDGHRLMPVDIYKAFGDDQFLRHWEGVFDDLSKRRFVSSPEVLDDLMPAWPGLGKPR